MKSKILFSAMFVLLFSLLYVPASYSQSPTFNFVLSNDTWDNHTIYTVDITVVSTDVAPIEFATGSFALIFNASALNGGTVTAAWVAGSSQLTNTAQIPGILPISNSGSSKLIRINGKVPPGTGNGSLLGLAPGTRIGTLKLTNSVDFVVIDPNSINIAPATVYPPNLNVYIAGINTDIWANGTIIKNLSSPLLPVELSTFESNVNGREVNLNWETKTEANSNRYEVERALANTKDATLNWTSIGTVKAAGSSSSSRKYSYTDKNLQSGKYLYRLKMIDFDGSYKYSGVVENEISLPKNFELSQNYPNPFNPSTRINYNIPFDSRVTLDVYNITGERMGQIVNEEQSAGYYTVSFSSSALNRSIASGVYIYKINAVDKSTGNIFTSIKKMMLLK